MGNIERYRCPKCHGDGVEDVRPGDPEYECDWCDGEGWLAIVPLSHHRGAVEALREIHRELGAGEWDIFPEVNRAVQIAARFLPDEGGR